MTQINKAPELLLAGEILELFIADCLIPTRPGRITPYPVVEQVLASYCAYLGVRQPSSKQLGAVLTARFPKVVQPTYTAYQVGINPAIIPPRDTNDTDQ